MKTLFACIVLISLIAAVTCQPTPQCFVNFYSNNPSVAQAVARNCAFLTNEVRDLMQNYCLVQFQFFFFFSHLKRSPDICATTCSPLASKVQNQLMMRVMWMSSEVNDEH